MINHLSHRGSQNKTKLEIRHEHLKQLGVFEKITGLVIGHIFGFDNKARRSKNPQLNLKGNPIKFENIILEATENYNFPILKINEFGHYCPHLILPIGAYAKVDATEKTLEIN